MEALTTNEVVALFNLDERRVRKEIEHGVFGTSRPSRFGLAEVVYMRTLEGMGFEVGAIDDRKKLYALILAATKRMKPTISLSPILKLNFDKIVSDVLKRFERFQAWKQKLVIDERILGGEPVFPKSRLAIRQVGGMLLRGASVEDIRADYPYLKDEDIEFAGLYARAYPRMGRPRERQAPAR